MRSARTFGICAPRLFVMGPSVSSRVPVADAAAGVCVRASRVVAAPTVPDPLTSPDVAVTDHEAPAGIAVSVVAETLVWIPTAARSGEKLTIVGHTRMPDASTVAVIRRLVGATMNVNVVGAAAPAYVALNEPEDTDAASELKVPVDLTSALTGLTSNVTGTVTDVPETSVSPVANVPRLTVFASTSAGIALVVSVAVLPSGAVTTALNCTDPEAGADDPSVYESIDTDCDELLYAYVPIVPYAVEVPESTHDTTTL